MAEVRVIVKTIDQATGPMKGIQSQFKSLAAGFGIAVGAITGMAVGFNKLMAEAAEAQRIMAQTQAVIKSTGGAAGVTAKQIQEMAEGFARTTVFEDDAIQAMQNVLLTFTKLGKDVLPSATQAVLDMSTALGSDLQSTAIQVGKALQDPILGVTALRRVGVNFNAEQTKVIKNLVETGRSAEAMALILKELNTEFGGSAAAQLNTYAGQVQQLKNNFKDLMETVGTPILPGATADLVVFNQVLSGQISPLEAFRDRWDLIVTGLSGGGKVIDDRLESVQLRIGGMRRALEEVPDVVKSQWQIDMETSINGRREAFASWWAVFLRTSEGRSINIAANIERASVEAQAAKGTQGGPQEFASGANFVVPPGYPNDSYPILVKSGERVIVMTEAQQRRYGFGLGGVEDVEVGAKQDADFAARTWQYSRLGQSWGSGGWFGQGEFRGPGSGYPSAGGGAPTISAAQTAQVIAAAVETGKSSASLKQSIEVQTEAQTSATVQTGANTVEELRMVRQELRQLQLETIAAINDGLAKVAG